MNDLNFDNLVRRFGKNIYHTAKGRIRLAVLWRDLLEYVPGIEQGGLSVLDVGAGQGHLALQLAEKGHQLTLTDISEKMLDAARDIFQTQQPDADVNFYHTPLQALSGFTDKQYDLVLCHAVMEWLAEPEKLIAQLLDYIKPGGYLSLMFYSRTGLIYQNLVHGNFSHVFNNQLAGDGTTLTPTNPQDPGDVDKWLQQSGLDVLCKSGVRVFYDGIHRQRRKEISEEEIIELEMRFSRQQPYQSLARYIHVIAKRSAE